MPYPIEVSLLKKQQDSADLQCRTQVFFLNIEDHLSIGKCVVLKWVLIDASPTPHSTNRMLPPPRKPLLFFPSQSPPSRGNRGGTCLVLRPSSLLKPLEAAEGALGREQRSSPKIVTVLAAACSNRVPILPSSHGSNMPLAVSSPFLPKETTSKSGSQEAQACSLLAAPW